MSYASAKRSYEQEKFEVSAEPVMRCRDCQDTTTRENLSAYGLRCWRCYEHWCRSAPKPETQKDYPGDPKAWARRILDKRDKGLPVSAVSLKLASEALGARHEL